MRWWRSEQERERGGESRARELSKETHCHCRHCLAPGTKLENILGGAEQNYYMDLTLL